MEGRDVSAFLAVLERIAKANEDLITLATQEREVQEAAPPPYCPHCRAVNPTVTSEGGTGEFADFVLVGKCQCGELFFAVPEGWNVHMTKEDAAAALGGGNDIIA